MGDVGVSLLYHPTLFSLLALLLPFSSLLHDHLLDFFLARVEAGRVRVGGAAWHLSHVDGGQVGGVVRIDSRENDKATKGGEMRHRLTQVMEEIMLLPPKFAPVKCLCGLCVCRQY